MQTLDEKIKISNLLYKEALRTGILNNIEKGFILNTTYQQFSIMEENIDLTTFEEFYNQFAIIKNNLFIDTALYENWLFSSEVYANKLFAEVVDGKDYVKLIRDNNSIENFFQLYKLRSEILSFYTNLINCSSSMNGKFQTDFMLATTPGVRVKTVFDSKQATTIIDESCHKMDENSKKLIKIKSQFNKLIEK